MKRENRILKRLAAEEVNQNNNKSSIYGEDDYVQQEVVDFIIEEMDWDGDSEVSPGIKSHDWYTPDEPGDVNLSVEGTLPIKKLTDKFGELSDNDLANIKSELEDNDKFQEEVKDIMNEFKDEAIANFSADITVTIANGVLKVSAEGDDFELDEIHDDEGDIYEDRYR